MFGRIALKSFVKIKLALGKTSSNNGTFASINKLEVNPPTELEFPWNDPPPRYPPIENSVWEKTNDRIKQYR